MKPQLERRLRRVLAIVGVLLLTPAVIILLLRWVEPPTSAFMLRAHWLQRSADGAVQQQWVDLDRMAPCMPLAVVAAEDQTFPYHRGFAWSALRSAMNANMAGRSTRLRGGSTISQQTVKNLFLWPGRSYLRKAVEGYLTLWLELLWPKRRILEMYLNIAQFDTRIFGVGAAASGIFGTTAAALSPYQCAALAAILPSPTRFSAAAPSAYINGRIRWIRRQMRQLGPHYLAHVLSTQ